MDVARVVSGKYLVVAVLRVFSRLGGKFSWRFGLISGMCTGGIFLAVVSSHGYGGRLCGFSRKWNIIAASYFYLIYKEILEYLFELVLSVCWWGIICSFYSCPYRWGFRVGCGYRCVALSEFKRAGFVFYIYENIWCWSVVIWRWIGCGVNDIIRSLVLGDQGI
jgi:hypothetical protein